MKKILLATYLLALLACNNSSPVQSSENSNTLVGDTNKMHIQIPKQGCYIYVTNKDTIRLKIETFPNVVTGTLHYHLYEKDKNSGDIEGVLRGDTLVADYNFMSEGVRSVRQVLFLIKDSTVLEGFGDMEEKDGKMIFKNISSVDFRKGTQLIRVSCVEDMPSSQPLSGKK